LNVRKEECGEKFMKVARRVKFRCTHEVIRLTACTGSTSVVLQVILFPVFDPGPYF